MRYDNCTPVSFGTITTVGEGLFTAEVAEALTSFVAGFMYGLTATFEGTEISAMSRASKSENWADAIKLFKEESERLATEGKRIVAYTGREAVALDGSKGHVFRYAVV